MRVAAGAAAAAVGLGAVGGASAAEYETITVGAGESKSFDLGSGDTLENVLVDVTADGADVHFGAHGDDWVIRNVGVRGRIDIGDTSPGGDDPSYEGGYNSVFTVDVASSDGTGLIENVYLGDGIEPGVDKSGLITATNHDGHIDVRNFNCGGFSTTAFYISGFGREETGGSMTIENSYFANSAGTAHLRPAGNVTIRNCVITNTNEAVYIPRTFGGVEQAMTSRGIWTSYSGSTTLVENCDIDVREENTCEAPWDYSGPCMALSVWAGDAPIDLVDCEVRGEVGGNVSQSGVGSDPDLSLPEGCPDSAATAAGAESASGGSGNDDGGDERSSITVTGGSPTDAVSYAFEVSDAVKLGDQANDEDSVDGATAAGLVGGGTDSFQFTGEVTDFTADGEVAVSIDGQSVDPNELASDGDYRNDDGDEADDGSETPELDRSITVSGGTASSMVQYSFSVSEAVEKGEQANEEDTASDSTASGAVGGWHDNYDFAGEVTAFDASGEVRVTIDGTEVDPAELGDGTDDGSDGSDDGEEESLELSNTIEISGGSVSTPVDYYCTVSEAIEKGPNANGEDSITDATVRGALGGGTDDYNYASEITAFDASGEVTVTINGEEVDPAELGDGTDDGSDDGEEDPELSRQLSVRGGSPTSPVDYSFTVTEAVAKGQDANAEDSASGTSASGTVGGYYDDYAFAGEVTSFEATGDVTLTIDGQSVDPASFGGGDDGTDDGSDDGSEEEPPELTNTIAIRGGSPTNVVNYAFSVSEAVAKGDEANGEDTASGTEASGSVGGWYDTFEFAGAITSFEADGDVSVTVNGSRVDTSSL